MFNNVNWWSRIIILRTSAIHLPGAIVLIGWYCKFQCICCILFLFVSNNYSFAAYSSFMNRTPALTYYAVTFACYPHVLRLHDTPRFFERLRSNQLQEPGWKAYRRPTDCTKSEATVYTELSFLLRTYLVHDSTFVLILCCSYMRVSLYRETSKARGETSGDMC